MVSSVKGPVEVAADELQQRQNPDNGTHEVQLTEDTGIHDLQKQGGIATVISEKSSQEPDAGVRISQLDKEGSVLSIKHAKASQTPGPGSHAWQSVQEGRTPAMIREKVSQDGYHWRKYGQKSVKGHEFIRNYYKCTHPSCQVKKQLECSHDGKIADIIYFGQHDHPKPQLNLPLAVGLVFSIVEERPDEPSSTGKEASHAPQQNESTNTSQISSVTSSEDVKGVLADSNRIRDEVDNDDDPQLKRQKKGNCNVDPTPVDKPTGEPRLVIQTLSEVDIVNDGYRWRKYGQKLVKGNPNPRSYYRCSSPGCPVKKHVERASHDPKVVITSYEGQHDHDMPASRSVTHNTTALNVHATAIQNEEPGAKSGESNSLSLDTVAYSSSSSIGKSKEQLNGDSKSKLKESDVNGTDAALHSHSGHRGKSSEQQKGKSSTMESDVAGVDMTFNISSVSESISNEQRNGKSRIASKESVSTCIVHTVAPVVESNSHEQNIPNPEPVQS